MKARTSCDACHLRKTKCDLGEGVSCTFCSSLGVPCRVSKQSTATSPSNHTNHTTGLGKHKRGKRIRALLADANQEEERASQTGTSVSPQTDQETTSSSARNQAAFIPTTSASVDHPSSVPSVPRSASSQNQPCLLGVPGLSVSALEICLDGFHDFLGVWMPLTQDRDVFTRRYQALLANVQGIERPKEGEEEDPMSELLLLAVAARGAPYTAAYAHLEKGLTEKVAALTRLPDNLGPNDLDGIEAVTLLAERSSRPLYLPSSLTTNSQGLSQQSCMVLDPLGKGFSAELCIFTKLNEESSPASPDYHRRVRLFWTIYCHDALRSASACRMYRLSDEEVGWPMTVNFYNQPVVSLAFLARKLCRIILSPRSRCLGVESKDVFSLLDDLATWPESVGISVDMVASPQPHSQPESQQPQQQSSSSSSSSTSPSSIQSRPHSRQHHLLVKQVVVLAFWLRLRLSLWTSLHEIGYLSSSDAMVRTETETARAAASMSRLAQVCVTHDLVDYGPNALLTTSAAWILYLVSKMSNIRPVSSSAQSQKKELLDKANCLLQAVRSSKTQPEAEALAQKLESMLQRANVVPLTDISRLAESSTAPIRGFQRGAEDGARKRKAQGQDRDQAQDLQLNSQNTVTYEPPLFTAESNRNLFQESQDRGADSNNSNMLWTTEQTPWNTNLQLDTEVEWDPSLWTFLTSCGIDMPFQFLQ